MEDPVDSPRTGRRPLAIFGLILLLAVGAWFGIGEWIRAAGATRLPAPAERRGQSAIQGRHLAEAEAIARSAPWSAKAVGDLGFTYHANVFYDRATVCYRLAEELDPTEWRWVYLRALLEAERGETVSMARALERAVELRPDHALSWYWLGEARFKLAKFDEAGEAFERAREIAMDRNDQDSARRSRRSPVAAHATIGLARVRIRREQWEPARALLHSVVVLAPRLGVAHRLLGRVLNELGRPEEATRSLRFAEGCPRYFPPSDPLVDELCERSSDATFLLKHAWIAEQANNAEWAEILLRRAVTVAPGDADTVVRFAGFLFDRGRADEAIPSLLRIRSLNHLNPRTGRKLEECMRKSVNSLYMVRRYRDVEKLLRDSIEKSPSDPILHGMLADHLCSQGQHADAATEFKKALEVHDDMSIRTRLGAALLISGREVEGMAELGKILAADPDNIPALILLVRSHTSRGRIEAAENLAPRLEAAGRNDAQAHLALAELSAKKDDVENARRHARRALELDPKLRAARTLLSRLPK